MRLPGPAGQGKPWDGSAGGEVLAGTFQFPQRQQQALPQPAPECVMSRGGGPTRCGGSLRHRPQSAGCVPQSLHSRGPASGVAGPSTPSKRFPKMESQSGTLYRPSPVPPHLSPTDQSDTGAKAVISSPPKPCSPVRQLLTSYHCPSPGSRVQTSPVGPQLSAHGAPASAGVTRPPTTATGLEGK